MTDTERALRRVYAFGAAYMGVVIMPIYTPFLVNRGLSAEDPFALQGIFALVVMLCDVPAGYLCDRIGRRLTIQIGTALNVVGLTAFASSHGFTAYALIQIVLGLGVSLVSGADIALIYDILDKEGVTRQARRNAIARYVLAQVLGEAVAGLFAGALATWSMNTVGWVTVAESFVPLLITLKFPVARPDTITHRADILPAVRAFARTPGLVLLFCNLAIWNVSTFCIVWMLQPYWLAQGIRLEWFGPLWTGTLLTVGLFGLAAPFLEKRLGLRGTVLLATLGPVFGYAAMGFAGGAVGIAGGYLFYISRGLNQVVLVEAFNHRVPPSLRATFNSLQSGLFRLGYVIIGPTTHAVVSAHGLNTALQLLAAGFAIAFVLVGIPLVWRAPRLLARPSTEQDA